MERTEINLAEEIEAQFRTLNQGVAELDNLLIVAELAAIAQEERGVRNPIPYWPGVIEAIRNRIPDIETASNEIAYICKGSFTQQSRQTMAQEDSGKQFKAMVDSFHGVFAFFSLAVKVVHESNQDRNANLPSIALALDQAQKLFETFGREFNLLPAERGAETLPPEGETHPA